MSPRDIQQGLPSGIRILSNVESACTKTGGNSTHDTAANVRLRHPVQAIGRLQSSPLAGTGCSLPTLAHERKLRRQFGRCWSHGLQDLNSDCPRFGAIAGAWQHKWKRPGCSHQTLPSTSGEVLLSATDSTHWHRSTQLSAVTGALASQSASPASAAKMPSSAKPDPLPHPSSPPPIWPAGTLP